MYFSIKQKPKRNETCYEIQVKVMNLSCNTWIILSRFYLVRVSAIFYFSKFSDQQLLRITRVSELVSALIK